MLSAPDTCGLCTQAGDVKAKARKQQCCAAWMWSWLVVFFAVIGASDYARVQATANDMRAAQPWTAAYMSAVSTPTAHCAGITTV